MVGGGGSSFTISSFTILGGTNFTVGLTGGGGSTGGGGGGGGGLVSSIGGGCISSTFTSTIFSSGKSSLSIDAIKGIHTNSTKSTPPITAAFDRFWGYKLRSK